MGPLLLGLGIGVASDTIIAGLKRLAPGSKTIIKNQLKTIRSFRAAIRPKFNVRSAMRSSGKLLARKWNKLGMAARVAMGMLWGKALAAARKTPTQIAKILTKRIGNEAAEKVGAKLAARAAARLGTSLKIGPLAAAELAITGISLGLDLSNTGGWGNIDQRQTSDLLKQR
jgi:hypothetical protein